MPRREIINPKELELSALTSATLQIGALSFDIECNGGDAAAIGENQIRRFQGNRSG